MKTVAEISATRDQFTQACILVGMAYQANLADSEDRADWQFPRQANGGHLWGHLAGAFVSLFANKDAAESLWSWLWECDSIYVTVDELEAKYMELAAKV